MRIEATYNDGFTEHLLRWKLIVNDGKAYLEADWFMGKSPVRAKFRFDDGPFRSVLPLLLSGMEEEYRAPCEDLDHRNLVVKDGGISIRRHVYGAGILRRERPEIEGFLKVWRSLEAVVLPHLPEEFHGVS